MVTAQLVWSVFAIACTSIGKAGLTVAAGVLLTRRGAFTPEVRRGLSKAAASLLVPCLLVERLSRTVTPELLASAWPIIPVGFLYVGMGCSLGFITAIGTRSEVRRPTIAATAFANSQAMPIILLEVIGPELFGPMAAATGITYIGLYLIVYLVLQWTIGAALLDVPMLGVGGGEKPAPSEAVAHAGRSGSSRDPDGSGQSSRPRVANQECDGISLTTAYDGNDDESPPDGATAGSSGATTGSGTLGVLSSRRRSRCALACCAVVRRVASPPIYGIFAGLCVGLVPPLRWLFVGDPSQGAAAHPPLRFVLQAAGLLGDAAIPLNTMLLGASLSGGPSWRVVPLRVVAGIVVSKLAIMPAIALVLIALLTAVTPIAPLLTLVILMESAMPTANNLMMMCELGVGGRASAFMSTVIFAQYLAAPIFMTASLTAFMAFVQAMPAEPSAGAHYAPQNVSFQ